MAYATINLEHPQSGRIKEAPIGFSWTTLLFGFFPALLRGHWIMALVMFLISIMTFGLSGIVFAFIYNNMYVKYLIGEGFKATSSTHQLDTLSKKVGIIIPELTT